MKRAAIKHIVIYLLPALVLSLNGCIKTQRDPDTYYGDKGYPLGTFEGDGLKIRRKTADAKYDTVKVRLRLTLSTNTGYTLTGDTTTWHAGSYGNFSEDFASIHFEDISYPSSSYSKKTRLSGIYTYDYYDKTLIIKPGWVQPDSLRFIYNLKKVK